VNEQHRLQTQTATQEVEGNRDVRRRLLRKNVRNNVRRLREDRLLSKAELARRAGVSPLTIDRVESGKPCRMDTKRKIILALGMTIENKDEVFVPGRESGDASEGAQPEDGQEQDEPQGS